jgi:hypothetical protein
MRVIQRRQHPGFALEPREPFGIAREERRENLDRDLATQLRVPGPVDLAHPARTNQPLDAIRPQ